jgi:2',3'-cyclic-nucleotide 2'-phosphodiesterase/3'-nucleotidase
VPIARRTALTLLCSAALAACSSGSTTAGAPQPPAGTTAHLALLESTDLHSTVRSYDYFKLAEDKSIGLERLATLIRQARTEFPNSLLIDNGDTIQGTVLADYQATVNPVACNQALAIHKAMDALGYDVGGVGNHEFNYGLSFLGRVTGNAFDVDVTAGEADPKAQRCAGPSFPLVLANVQSVRSGQPLFKPFTILTRTIQGKDPQGNAVSGTIRVGVVAFTPPQIMAWDKRWLDGKVYTTGLYETATRRVKEMKDQGADVVVVVSHGGLDASSYAAGMENGSYYLAFVEDVDALLLGHSHQVFPLATSTQAQFNLPNVDKVKGTVFGVPTVMGNFWGKHLGVIDLALTFDGARWAVDRSHSTSAVRPIQDPVTKLYVDPDAAVAPLVEAEHQATIAYVKTPIGTTDFRMTTYFADVGEVGAVEIVNQAQAAYVTSYIAANLPQHASLPVLSVSAPFKSGFGGGTDYTDVPAGPMAINNAADLYLYPNTVYAVKVTGATLKGWLEKAAGRFNRIDPALTTAQQLVGTFPGYNFDVFTSPDISYEIDVTQPLGSRIKGFTYKAVTVDAAQEFVVATNNYRGSGGGGFLDGTGIILAAPDTNRDVLIAHVKQKVHDLTRAANGSDRSWHFTKVTTAGPVLFTSAQGVLAVAAAAGLTNVSLVNADDGSGKGTATYAIDLSR